MVAMISFLIVITVSWLQSLECTKFVVIFGGKICDASIYKRQKANLFSKQCYFIIATTENKEQKNFIHHLVFIAHYKKKKITKVICLVRICQI